jgi:predicted ATPase/class 3 adenylate cyclase/DNA-binding CsgD family transcriptional regulator
MGGLPDGIVTFLLTDVEGSTTLWERAPKAMRDALARHDLLFEQVIREHGGIHIRPRGEGDSRFAVFSSAPGAVAAALGLQRAFSAESWPTPWPLAVRIGLHTGTAELRDDDYYGSAVNRCARLRSIGHGGQVLLSEAASVLVRDDLPPDTRLIDHGPHRLKDVTHPERVFQLVADDLDQAFRPLASLDVRPHNLPVQATVLLGRERDVDGVRQALLRAEARLVTLTGPGGTGKTRLGLQVAAEVIDQFGDGVFFVELAPISDPTLVPSAIAQVLGVRDMGGRPIVESLKEYLRRRSLLLVLDNFEQIVLAAPTVADLLASSPGLRVLVTSREPLRLRGEREYAVPPLALPDDRRRMAPEELSRYAAAALFVERATEIRADFAVTAENAIAIAEICTRLDGLPLAIELAAARVRLLSPEAMLARLDRRLPLLTQGAQDLPARQRTLRDAIAWSYDLLTPAEQALFRRLAVFVGGCTLEAAEAVATAEAGDRRWALDPFEALDGVESLIAKSLLRQVSGPDDVPRIAMLETIREYGVEELRRTGELQSVRRWHAGYFLGLAERAVPRFRGPEQPAWLDRLEAEHANLRAALEWCLTDDQTSDTALRLSGALAWFWASRAYASESRRWLTRALAQASPASAARLPVLYGAGWIEHVSQNGDAAREPLEAALALARELDDRWAMSWTLHVLGRVAYFAGDAATTRTLAGDSLKTAREIGDEWLIAWALHLHGLAEHISGEYRAARTLYETALTIRRRLGYQEGMGICLMLLGMASYQEADYPTAHAEALEGLRVFRASGASWSMGTGLALLATIAALTNLEQAVRLTAATRMLSESLDIAPIPLAESILRPALDHARSELSPETFEAAWAEGRALSLDEAVAEARTVAVPSAPIPPSGGERLAAPATPVPSTTPHPAAGLSPREVEVLRLLAAGQTSKEVAEALVLSVRTVERHITHVYEKIGARGRADAAAFALKHGLL